MVPVSASTSFLSCPSTRSTVGGSKVLFPLILRIFQFCHKYKCKYYHKYKYKSNKKGLNVVLPRSTFFFVCCSYLTIQISFMVTVTKKSTFTNTNTNTSTHPKFEHRRCCFQLSFEYFNAMDSFLSPLQQYHQSPQLCALQKCSQRLKEKLSEISGKKQAMAISKTNTYNKRFMF